MNGYDHCTEAQRNAAKLVAATYPTAGYGNGTPNVYATLAKANGYTPSPVATPGLVALCEGTTRVRAGIIVKGTKTRAYVLYYVQSTDRYYITTVDLAFLYVIKPKDRQTWDGYYTWISQGRPATTGLELVDDITLTDIKPTPGNPILTDEDQARIDAAKALDEHAAPAVAKAKETIVDVLKGTSIDPIEDEALAATFVADRTGDLRADSIAWLESKGYGQK